MQFADKQFKHNNEIASSFRKPVSCKSDRIAELAEEICDEMFDLKFQDMFSSLVHDLAESAVAKELEADKVEFDMHQGDKVGASAFGELVRAANKVNLMFFLFFLCFSNSI